MLRLLDEFPALSLGLLDETFLTDILGAMTGQIKKEGSFAEYGDCLDVIDPKKNPRIAGRLLRYATENCWRIAQDPLSAAVRLAGENSFSGYRKSPAKDGKNTQTGVESLLAELFKRFLDECPAYVRKNTTPKIRTGKRGKHSHTGQIIDLEKQYRRLHPDTPAHRPMNSSA